MFVVITIYNPPNTDHTFKDIESASVELIAKPQNNKTFQNKQGFSSNGEQPKGVKLLHFALDHKDNDKLQGYGLET